MIFNLLFSIFISSSVFGFDNDFKTLNDRVPLEFNYLFESMKSQLQNKDEKIQFVEICKELDKNLGTLTKENIYFLMKSEVIKNTLEYKHNKVRSFDITSSLISKLEDDLEIKQKELTVFSTWIWRSIIAELKYRQSIGLISSKTFNPNHFEKDKKSQAQRLAKYLTYLIPWIDKMEGLTTKEFNELTKKVSWVILRRINESSILFQQLASTASGSVRVSIFNFPENILKNSKPTEETQIETTPLSLKEESHQERVRATQQIQNISPDDLSPLSDELSKELEQNAP